MKQILLTIATLASILIEYNGLAEFLNQKIEYKQEIVDHSAIESMAVKSELEEQDESDDKVYFVYFVEVFFDEKGSDF